MKSDNEDRQRITICTKKDFDVSYFCGSGPGGQARNKSATGVQIIHRESGAIGRASDSRSQHDNKKNAFDRLLKTPQMKFWIAKKKFEIDQHMTVEESIERDCADKNMKYEIKNAKGEWEEVDAAYFDGPAAKEES